jgi:hypothetical protein
LARSVVEIFNSGSLYAGLKEYNFYEMGMRIKCPHKKGHSASESGGNKLISS